jgi:hypothetical protein
MVLFEIVGEPGFAATQQIKMDGGLFKFVEIDGDDIKEDVYYSLGDLIDSLPSTERNAFETMIMENRRRVLYSHVPVVGV